MAKYSNQVTYDIKTTLDASGITKLRSELSKLNQDVATIGKSQWGLKDSEIQRTINQVNRLQRAITECFNPKIGMLDLSKFNKTLEQEKALLGTINADWAKMGAQGTRAINSLAASVLTLNRDAITVNSTLSKIANTFGNTVRWGITASIFQEMMSSVQGAVSYMKDLDESLTQIQMVTNSSKENMRELAQYANNAAQALGSTTVDYTNAVKVFVQEGFSESESKQYANLSTKLANVSEQNTATTSDQITAYRNAFQLDYEQTVAAMDKVANVANNTASNVNELMTASQRAASVAQAVGSSQDSFLAAIATIESVTRQSAEEIGNGLKTIYQRFADIKVSGSTDDGVDYGQYANALKSVGVDVLDAAGSFKGMDQILSELQDVWSELDDTMKIAVGEKVAGKFQYNRFAALMNNPEYYQKALGATQNANGMMDQMNDYYVESIEGRLNTLQTAGEQIISTLFDQDNIEPVIGAATDFLNVINKIIDSVGGGLPVFTALSGILLRTFNAQIGEQAARIATNIQASMQISRNANFVEPVLGQIQGLQEARGEDTSVIGEIRGTLQGKGFANLTDDTRDKIKDSALELLEAETKVAEIKENQKRLQDEITNNILNSGEAADALLSKEKALFEEKQKIVEEDEAWLNHAIEIGDISDDEIIAREQELEISRKERDEAERRYEQTKVAVNVEGDFNKLTLEQAEALDSVNAKLNNRTNYAEQYLKVTRETQQAQGELNVASDKMKGVGEQISMEWQAASITNLVSSLTSAVFLTQSLVSLWQLWTNEDASFEDKVVGTISSLAMILPMAVTAYQAFVAVEWESVAAAKAFIATPVGAVIMAIVAAVGIAVGAFTAWQNIIHAASKEFENQKKILSETKKNYSDLKDEVESLKQSIDSIGETKSSLTDLTKGTDEWREAVRKLNDQVLTLLQTYPELAQYVKNEDGVLSIDDVGMDQFYQQQLNKADHLASVNSVQQINTLQTQNKKYVEDFSNQWGISKEEISSAIEEGTYSLEGKSDLLNASFAELVNKVQINSTSIDNLSDNIGTLNTTYSDYSSKEDVNLDEVKETIREQYGVIQYDEYGNSIGTKLDFSTMTNNQEFLDAVAEATGKNIIGATDTSWFDGNVKFKTNDGDEFEYTTDQLLNLLADSQAAIGATNRKLEENRIIYEAFGARYDEAGKKFINSSGETVSSLEDLNGITGDEIAAIEAFQDEIYNDIAVKNFNGSLEEFVAELKNGTLSVDGFSEALLAARVQQKEEGIFGDEGRLTSLSQTQGVMANVDGVPENLKLSSGQAKAIMADMMKKLNESDLSDDEKLQLMDKIDWNMPVQDILANIQHAIDTGNINSAFVNTAGLEDDSERKSKVLEDYDIEESTLNAYTEQLQMTGELAEQHEKLADSLEYAKEQFGAESNEAKDAREALSDFDDESEDIAVDLAQTQKGLEALSNGMSKYGDILKNGDKTTLEYAEALGTVKKALADTLNVSEESVSNSLIENHLQDIEALAAGDEEALNRLRAAAGQDIAMGFYMSEDSNLTEEHLQLLENKALEINSLDLEVGASIDDEQFRTALNDMLYNGELTKDQVNEYLRGIGVEPHFETIKKPTTLFSTEGMSVSGEMFGIPYNFDLPPFQIDGMVDVPQIIPEGETAKGGTSGGGAGLRRTASPTAPSGKSGISSSYVNNAYKPKDTSSTSKQKDNKPKDNAKNEWDYLTDITNDLDRQAAIIEKLSKLEDRLYGKGRVSQLKKIQAEHRKNIKLLQQEFELAQSHARKLRTDAYDENGNLTINGYAYRAGFNQVNFDSKGNLENGQAIEAALTQRLNNAIAEYNVHRNDEDTGYYEDQIKNAQEDRDGFLKALSDYESTLGVIEDTQSQILDEKEKIQDATDTIVDAIQDGVDDMVEAIDNQRDFNKMYRDWMQGGSDYSHFGNSQQYYTEGLSGLLSPGQTGQSVFNLELTNLKDRIKDFEDVFDVNGKDGKNAEDEKLSQQAAFENLQNATSSITDTLHQMIEYYDSLLKTIEEASSKMDNLIDDRLNEFDRLEDYLDTRLDQLKLVFGDKSYEEQAQIYDQKIAVNMEKMNSITTAIKEKQATVEKLEELEATNKELSTENRKTLEDARDKINSLQEEQLSVETQMLKDEQQKKKVQVTAEVNSMISTMFNGADVDWLSEQWELASRNSEKYLDDYNRSYEIQKLELKFQEALNDAQNSSLMTQQKINDLSDEYLTYLREKNNLSEYDVKHAQMQLDILQKQIALEDARNNKSQMRLQRNAAGNYDFVYGADEGEVNKAQEALLQAQQDSYNLSKQAFLDTYESAYEAALKARDMIIEVAMDASLGTEQQVERIHYILNNLSEYMTGSKVELDEIGVNLYNSFVEASQSITEINQGALGDVFEQMRQQAEQAEKTVEGVLTNTNAQIESFGTDLNTRAEDIHNNLFGVINKTRDSLVGETGALGSIKTGIGDLEQSLIGEDGTLNKIRVGTDTSIGGIKDEIIAPVLQGIDERFDLSQTHILEDVTGIETAAQNTSINITGTTSKSLDDIDTSVKEALIEIHGAIADTDGNVETIVDGNVARVKEMGEKVEGTIGETGKTYEEILEQADEKTKNAIENVVGSGGYLQQFENTTRQILSSAGDSYDNFTKNSINHSSEQLDVLKGKTESWRQDLGYLNTRIGECAEQVKSWKGKIDSAVKSSETFIGKSNSMQQKFAGIAGLSAIAESRLDNFSEAADGVGSAVQTMANDIDNSYGSITDAANAAKDAYDQMKQSAEDARIAADEANTAMENAKSAASSAITELNNFYSSGGGNFGYSNSYDPYAGNIYYYGDGNWGAMYDTGGYTGSWSDKGIDDKSGKWAILHQKELVLNRNDTENMLSAVEIVRDIMSNINKLSSLGNGISSNAFNNSVEQRVEISATFPGVTTALEIERALTELADNAYQYSNRYKY